jgi:alkylation response protein AidB-like acyl-CoA dehydrogenase
MRTTARRSDRNTWVVNGHKDAVVNLPGADLSVVVAREHATGGLCAFLIDQPSASLSIERDDAELGKLGLSAAPTAAFVIDELVADDAARLAAGSTDAVERAVCRYRLTIAAIAVGTASAAFDYAAHYANERIAFGKPISSFQSIGFMLVDMRMAIEAARLSVWEAACAVDGAAVRRPLETLTDNAVSYACAVATRSTRQAVQVLGGHGYLADHPVERWYRGAAALSVMDFDPIRVELCMR